MDKEKVDAELKETKRELAIVSQEKSDQIQENKNLSELL